MSFKYEEDLYGWSFHTAKLLRNKKIDEVDIERVAECVENLGKLEKGNLVTKLALIMTHILQWYFHAKLEKDKWIHIIEEWREEARKSIEKNPSLNNFLEKIMEDAYKLAVHKAVKMSGAGEHIFPPRCPYAFNQIMNDDFYEEQQKIT